MSEKHTAGEWRYGVRRDGSIWLSIGDRKGSGAHYQGDLVATVPDAQLIYAAPKMLLALRRAALALAFAAESSAAMQDDYEAVSAAIALATNPEQSA